MLSKTSITTQLAQLINGPDLQQCALSKPILEQLSRISASVAMSSIQITHFVLNEIEFPTPYSKYIQAKAELSTRFNQMVSLYYDIKASHIKLRKRIQTLANTTDNIDIELQTLKKEKSEIRLANLRAAFQKTWTEARIFFEVYNQHPEFHTLSEKEAALLELDAWQQKAKNMPTVFEERYGTGFLRAALADDQKFKEYVEDRRKFFGLLPRELLDGK